ncbi:MAG: ribonuclease III [Caldiserica bacterium]|nr:MAG: ribonuclease III [Caldisericota bacterium]
MDEIEVLENRIGYKFKDKKILEQALQHSSYLALKGEKSYPGERLEFLGDAVLNFVVSSEIVEKFPDADEGKLTRLRASLVNSKNLSKCASRIKLKDFVKFAPQIKEEVKSPELLADFFESLIGAVYVDGGISAAEEVIKNLIDFSKATDAVDFKTQLQELVQKKYGVLPEYEVVSEKGPEHKKIFEVVVKIKGRMRGRGEGRSKKIAEQKAAEEAIKKLEKRG